jgi:hypothetical protein
MLRVVFGLIKGGVIGAAVGFGVWKLGLPAGALTVAGYAVVGALVGALVGKPLWRQETIWTSILKSVFGAALAVGLYFGARKLLGDTHLAFATGLGAPDKPLVDLPFLLGPVIGALYGIFVEVDDNSGGAPAAAAPRPSGGPPPRR